MSYHCRLNQSLMIDKLISLTGLNLIIQHQAFAKTAGTKYFDGLVLRLPGVQYLFYSVQLNEVSVYTIV